VTLTLRYMRLEDVPQVITIDRLSFDPPWSARSYNYEITESNYSHMVVLEHTPEPKQTTGLRRLMQNLSGHAPTETAVVGYGGLWHIVDEAHVSTIATHPDMRGKGYGEIVLAGMVRRAMTLQAGYIVLEVRVSNTPAQNLYKKWEFEAVDVKPRYYHNNGEDAYDMRLDLRDPARRQRLEERFTALCEQTHLIDHYTADPPPHGQT
jgi:ribosomal-protein-alanine N-acetyltransferase